MSRVAKPIKCNEEDINILKSIISNPLSSEILRTKAKAVLLANEGKENKTIAVELSTREMSVGEWRKRYLQLGVEGLYGAERSGRRGNGKPNIRKLIAKKLKSQPISNWTIESLATEFKTSKDTVRRALKDAKIEIPGSHNREIRTDPLSDTRTIFIAGLYLSTSEKVIVLKSDVDTTATSHSGITLTKSNINAKAIESSSNENKPAKIINALKTLAKNGTDRFGGRVISVGEFLNNLSASICKSTESKIHIIIQQDKQECLNLRYPNISTTMVRDCNLWIEHIQNWLRPLCADSEEIIEAVKTYIAGDSGRKEPFIWISESNTMDEDKQYTPNITEESSNSFTNNRMRVIINLETKDGIVKDYDFVYNDIFPSFSEISYETPISLANSLGQVERGASSAFNDINRTVVQDFMNETNKKKLR